MAWWHLLHFKIQALQSLNAASMFLDFGWLSERLDEILTSHMIQEKLPMSLCRRTLGQGDCSQPSFLSTLLCCHRKFVRLWVDWRKGSPTRLSTQQKDTQSMSSTTAWSTPPWGGPNMILAHIDTHSSSPRAVTHHLSYAVCSAFNSHLDSIKAVNWEVGCTVFLKFLSHCSLQWRCVRLLSSYFVHRSKRRWRLLSENKTSWCPHELARDAEGNQYSRLSVA